KCGLTGENISLDTEIELDHIIPTTRGGTNDISNLRWVTKDANRLKQNKTDSELKELCKKILQTI
ncbi:HNH endonuclease, partial [Enterococcus faecium]